MAGDAVRGGFVPFLEYLALISDVYKRQVNPETSIDKFKHLLPEINKILAMRVRPGFAGQRPIDENDKKIKYLVQKYPNIEVSIDGGVSLKNIEEFAACGVKGFVLGTASIFGKKESYQLLLQHFINK